MRLDLKIIRSLALNTGCYRLLHFVSKWHFSCLNTFIDNFW